MKVRTPRGTRLRRLRIALAGAATALGLAGGLLAGAVPASAATLPAPDLAGLRQDLQAVQAAGAPGVFARISNADGTSATVAVGTGNLSTHTPVDPQGRFRVGSITKNFTAVLVLQLVAEHRMDLDQPATTYLPSGVLPTAWGITPRQLLNHTSGLFDYTNDLLAGDTVSTYKKIRYQTYDPASQVADAVGHGLPAPPGTAYSYSNTNFVVLGIMLQHVTGQPYARLLNDRILQPLHLTRTSYVVPRIQIAGPHAEGYLTQDNPALPLFDATLQTGSWIDTAGAIISSTSDLNHYWQALATGRLLPPAQLADMEHTLRVNSTTSYGLGLREYTLPCGTTVMGHDGIVQGYETYSYATLDGARQVTISADTSNNNNVHSALLTSLTPVFCSPQPVRAQ